MTTTVATTLLRSVTLDCGHELHYAVHVDGDGQFDLPVELDSQHAWCCPACWWMFEFEGVRHPVAVREVEAGSPVAGTAVSTPVPR